MDNANFSQERTAIRFSIQGDWSCEEFAEFLSETADTYHRLNSIFVLHDAIQAEDQFNAQARANQNYDQQVFAWQRELFGQTIHHPGMFGVTTGQPYDKIIGLTQSVTAPLQIDSISYSSPGWIQLIGAWNPLKVLAEFISKWRAENTKREANRMKYETERLRIQSDLASTLLSAAPKLERQYEGGAARLVDMAESVIMPASRYIQRTGTDARIVAVETVPVGALPPPPSGPDAPDK